MNKLLKKATSYRKLYKSHPAIAPTRDEVAVAIAYLKGEITIRAYAAALSLKNPGNASHRLGTVLRYALDKGYVEIKVK